ncbi:hypothetical protein JYQ77_10915, partial [Anaerobutyricum soehngenii]|uniref:hypothetical protein n=1 Tax=Anaerobutyricum soehngenii TaxID=105843 RepID=UPI001ADD6943
RGYLSYYILDFHGNRKGYLKVYLVRRIRTGELKKRRKKRKKKERGKGEEQERGRRRKKKKRKGDKKKRKERERWTTNNRFMYEDMVRFFGGVVIRQQRHIEELEKEIT